MWLGLQGPKIVVQNWLCKVILKRPHFLRKIVEMPALLEYGKLVKLTRYLQHCLPGYLHTCFVLFLWLSYYLFNLNFLQKSSIPESGRTCPWTTRWTTTTALSWRCGTTQSTTRTRRCGRPWSRPECRTHWRKPLRGSGIRRMELIMLT